MQCELKYGLDGLVVDFGDDLDITVVEPQTVPALDDPAQALFEALEKPIGSLPLAALAAGKKKIGIIFNDITRATPSKLMLPIIIRALGDIPKEKITLFNALGTHRENTREELCSMIGEKLVSDYQIIQNDYSDISTQKMIGMTSFGHEAWVNRKMAECDLIILTGFIEPHFFAGFSGAGKAIMPGMAGKQTIFGNHDAKMISNPKSTWGITDGNPLWEEIQEVAELTGKLFIVNVTMNKFHEITGVFAGNLRQAHAMGAKFVKQSAMAPLPEPFDVVVTTNSGFPLDMNLYQSVKGLSAAAQVVKRGGTIIIASACSDGIPDHGLFGPVLKESASADDALNRIFNAETEWQDQWQVQVLAQILKKAEVYIYTDGLTQQQIEDCLLKQTKDIAETCRKIARNGKICIIPQGPLTIPYIVNNRKE